MGKIAIYQNDIVRFSAIFRAQFAHQFQPASAAANNNYLCLAHPAMLHIVHMHAHRTYGLSV
jgi:hypothetical protein